MREYIVFLKKELNESVKTFKLLILGAVFLIFGMSSPLMAKMMPEILKWAMETDPSTAGMDLSGFFTNPTAFDAWAQFYGNVGQMGLIILVVVFSGMLSSEIGRGTLTIILTKGLSRSAAILSKLTSAVLVWTGCLAVSFFTAWGYTIYLFPGESLPHVLLGGFCLWLFGVFLLALTALAAVITVKSMFCMLAVGAVALVLTLVNIIPAVGKYNPASLLNSPILLLSRAESPQDICPTLIATVIGIAVLALLAVHKFSRKKSMKMPVVLAVTAVVCMSAVIFFGEGTPARIKLGRAVISESVTIGEGTEWELSGLLTIPRNANGKVPAVVLVHGSGASDMNQTIFQNQPFREIAEYLSSNGIAVIRYNKRNYTHALKLAEQADSGFSVWEETMEDALLATEILKADPRVDENKVFILGHSLGGMLAPRIHLAGGDYAGLILFAGSPRSLLDIMIDQQTDVLAAMTDEADIAFQTEFNNQFIEFVESLSIISENEARASTHEALGAIYYWWDMHRNPAAEIIESITVPFLVMHPANDLHVCATKDFGSYKELLGERDNVTFRFYEGLNHLFMPSTAENILELMDEYAIKSKIKPQVLRDIKEWVLSF